MVLFSIVFMIENLRHYRNSVKRIFFCCGEIVLRVFMDYEATANDHATNDHATGVQLLSACLVSEESAAAALPGLPESLESGAEIQEGCTVTLLETIGFVYVTVACLVFTLAVILLALYGLRRLDADLRKVRELADLERMGK